MLSLYIGRSGMVSRRMTLKQRLEGREWSSVALWGKARGPGDLGDPQCARRWVVGE